MKCAWCSCFSESWCYTISLPLPLQPLPRKVLGVDTNWISSSISKLVGSFCKTDKVCGHTYPNNDKEKNKRTLESGSFQFLHLYCHEWLQHCKQSTVVPGLWHTTKSGFNWKLTQSIGLFLFRAPCPQMEWSLLVYTVITLHSKWN